MAGLKEIRSRMDSVRDTQKITQAMYLIASAKMRKAKEELDRTRPFFNAVQAEIKRIFRTDAKVEDRYFYPLEGKLPEGTVGCLVITADKGLAGAYNQNVIKAAKEDKKLEVPARQGDALWTRNAPSVFRQTACPCKACQADRLCRGTGQQVFVQETDRAVGQTCRKGVLGRRVGRAPAGHKNPVKNRTEQNRTGQGTGRRTTLKAGQETALANRTCTPCA